MLRNVVFYLLSVYWVAEASPLDCSMLASRLRSGLSFPVWLKSLRFTRFESLLLAICSWALSLSFLIFFDTCTELASCFWLSLACWSRRCVLALPSSFCEAPPSAD